MKAFKVTLSLRTYRHSTLSFGSGPPDEIYSNEPMLIYAYTAAQAQEIAKAYWPPELRPNVIGCKELLTLTPPPESAEEDR